MTTYRNFISFLANRELALDLRPMTVIVGPTDSRKTQVFDHLHALQTAVPEPMEVHTLLRQFHLTDTLPQAIVNLTQGRIYDPTQLGDYTQARTPVTASDDLQDPGLSGEHLFPFFASLPVLRQSLIMSHLKHVLGPVAFDPEPTPKKWTEGPTEYSLATVPANRLALLWLLCALYDNHPLKLFIRPERGLGKLPSVVTDALTFALRQASAFGQVIVETYHAGLIGNLDPTELLLIKPQERHGIWASDLDPSLFEDRVRFIRYAMGLAA